MVESKNVFLLMRKSSLKFMDIVFLYDLLICGLLEFVIIINMVYICI